MERRLSAILAADVVGYSRLMSADEAGTLAALKRHRSELVDGLIAAHQGRIFKLTGDGMLAEFSSVVNAVACAAKIQQEMRTRNGGVAEERRMEFRIGVHLGDVMVDDNDVYGDGVNLAARIESIARPGGVAVSASVRDNVGNRLGLAFEDAGEQMLKNIDRPVRVYNVSLGAAQARAVAAAPLAGAEPGAKGRPSIAVLPFINMSGDPEQEYFSDGITEDIITDLSKVSGLFVVARNSVFTYKGRPLKVQEVSRELGVRHVLEGSVRKAGGRVRITAQLIDGSDGGHVWAERYDRTLDDIFALQDEISRAIVDALKVKLLPEELATITTRSTGNVEAYQTYLMGRSFFHRGNEMQPLRTARRLFAKAIEIDPTYARAHAGLADAEAFLLCISDPSASYEVVLASSTRALELEPGLADARASRGLALFTIGRHAEAEAEFEQALALDANSFEAHFFYGRNCFTQGQYDEAEALFRRAVSLAPADYRTWGFLQMIHVSQGRPGDAAEASRQGVLRVEKEIAAHPDNASALCYGAIMLAELGEVERALSWSSRAEIFAGDDVGVHYNLACAYAKLGQPERALDCLERQLSASAVYKGWSLSWMKQDSDLDSVRDHPRFRALVEQMQAEVASAGG
jgi:adenylate cyclase